MDALGNPETDIISSSYFDSYFIYDIYRNGILAIYNISGTQVATGDADPDTDTIGAQFYVRDSEYDIYCDWILIREWVDPEPSHTSWGSEESVEGPPAPPVDVYPYLAIGLILGMSMLLLADRGRR